MKPSKFLVAAIFAVCLTAPANAVDSRMKAMLKRIEPQTRLVQVCDIEAMVRINRDRNPYHPDRAMVDQLSPPHVEENTLSGSGGVFRSRGDWYHFSFVCSASPDRLDVLSFQYKIGERIPKEEWSKLNLFP